MAFTIREALQLPDMVHTRLVAGQSGLDNPIRWVTIVELLEDASRLQEGEFLITTGFGLGTDPQKAAQFIPSLAKQKLCGVAIHTGFYLREIPNIFIEHANHYELPLIEIPSETNFSTITKAMLQPIINRQFDTLAYFQAIHEQMIEVAFSKGGLPAITAELAKLTRGHVRLVDSFGFEVVKLPAPMTDSAGPAETEGLPMTEHTVPIRATRETYATLILSKPKAEWQELDHIALRHAATLCTFEYVKERAVAATEWRLMGDFAEELLSGNLLDQSELETRSRKLGYPLAGSHLIAAIRVSGKSEAYADRSVLHARLRNLFQQFADRLQTPSLIRERSHYFLFILPAHEKSLTLLERTAQEWHKTNPDSRLELGYSGPRTELADLRAASDEAIFAMLVYSLIAKPPQLVDFGDLKGYQFLFPYYRDAVSLERLWQPLLGRLLAYDEKHQHQLTETLETYIRHNCNGIQAAQALFIHRHTLKYRLEQIVQKTGLDINDFAHRWQLQLALMAYRLHRLLYTAEEP